MKHVWADATLANVKCFTIHTIHTGQTIKEENFKYYKEAFTGRGYLYKPETPQRFPLEGAAPRLK